MIDGHANIEIELSQEFTEEEAEALREEFDLEEGELATFIEGELAEAMIDVTDDEERERLEVDVTLNRVEEPEKEILKASESS